MLSTKHILKRNAKEIPEEVIYETYLGITLNGQDVKMKSIFNKNESKPSMYVYVHNGKYRWKDFSTGKQGNAIQLVREILNCSFEEACNDVLDRIKPLSYTERKIVPVQDRYNVTSFEKRDWNTKDLEYWAKFDITPLDLNKYKVYPLESYTLTKQGNELNFHQPYMYGYFNNDGLYKIYQPKNKECKFLKVHPYIQGTEQLEGKDSLIITKSIKDLICLNKMLPNVDLIAVDSENTFLETEYVSKLKKQYKSILVIFDNDRAGIESMKYYKQTFRFNYLIFPFGKDIADCVRDLGFDTTKHYLLQKIKL